MDIDFFFLSSIPVAVSVELTTENKFFVCVFFLQHLRMVLHMTAPACDWIPARQRQVSMAPAAAQKRRLI